jgi:hypothetical protein
LGKIGEPLTRSICQQYNKKTKYEEQVEASKTLRGLQDANKLSIRWHHGFLHRHYLLLTTSGTVIKDVKRRTWVAKENFENMYKNMYKTMVEAGVAEARIHPICG